MSEPTEQRNRSDTRFKLRGWPVLATVAAFVTIAATTIGVVVTEAAVAGSASTGTYADGSPSGANLGAVIATAPEATGCTNCTRADLIGVTPGGDHVLVFNGSAIVCYNADLGGRVSTSVQAVPDEWVVAPSGGLFYGAGSGAGISLHSFTVNSDCSVKEGINVSFAPNGFASNFGISGDGSKLYVFDLNGAAIYEIDATTGDVERTLPTPLSRDAFQVAGVGPLFDETESGQFNHSSINSKGETLALVEYDNAGTSIEPADNRFAILKGGNTVTTITLGKNEHTINSMWIGKDMHHLYAGVSSLGPDKVLLIDASAPRVNMAYISVLIALLAVLVVGLWVLTMSEPRWRPRFLAARERSRQLVATAEEAHRLQVDQWNKDTEARQHAEDAEASRLAQVRAEAAAAGFPAGLVGGGVGAGATGQIVQVVPQTNGLAVAAIIVVWFIPFLGVILGHLALSQINRVSVSGITQSGRGLALAGAIIGWVFTGAGVITAIVYIAVIASALR